MTKSFAIQEEDKGSKRRMENLPTVNGVGITDSNQSGSGQIMRITVAVVHEEVEQKLWAGWCMGRRDEQEEGMNIIVVVSIWIWKREKEKKKIIQKTRKRNNDRDKINDGKENLLAGTENKKWREKEESTNDGQKCIGK
jgi:hypothetical protein